MAKKKKKKSNSTKMCEGQKSAALFHYCKQYKQYNTFKNNVQKLM